MNFLKKLGLSALGLLGLVNTANAAVAFDNVSKSFTGEFDLAPYYSAIGIVITAIAVVAAIKLAVGQFKRV